MYSSDIFLITSFHSYHQILPDPVVERTRMKENDSNPVSITRCAYQNYNRSPVGKGGSLTYLHSELWHAAPTRLRLPDAVFSLCNSFSICYLA